MRRAPSTVSALFGAALALPAPAFAQGFSASRYLAPPSGEDLALTERALVTPHLRVGAAATAEYTHALSTRAGLGVLDHRVTAHLAVTLGLFDRLQIGVVAPLVLTQQRGSNADGVAPGDLRVDVRVRVAGLARGGTTRLALAASLLAPLGDRDTFTGDGAVGVAPRVIFEATNSRDFVFALNAGVALRPGWEHQMFARAGVTIPLAARVLLSLEASFEARLTDPGAKGSLALEALAGVRHVSRGGLALGVAAGPRLLDGDGTADVRVVAMGGYAPQPPRPDEAPGDRDLDGVLDPDDRCPDLPAGPRPDPNARGCPIPDRDHDGFRDEVDACPTQPPGDDPDPRRMGCPNNDRDGDGVGDDADICPLEAAGSLPDPRARGCPQRDGDHDGVADTDDVCPLEPAGAHPDGARRGCPAPDIDGDGILNARDACPEERGPHTRDPATNGCPRVYVSGDRVVITQQPRFAVDRDVILAASAPLLAEVAGVLEAHPELTAVEVRGHTDSVGDDAHNMDLSQRRAASIRAWLLAHGIDGARVTARGYGETQPIADNGTAAGRAGNRRVEFVVTAREAPPRE
jgi:outer membrane protein OmpA-like peptidoglycan-associated protein